ncbi:hypothetical protein JTE90_010711 [Oedothorax gibbosus]|uniref:Uncharacterized protein n=1 Tax=Oedothorax gibbosus TaxID=931172 RepID=A0AAV6UP21_9ARAC|nr:hypothetical protein JTE90_010711 [Oedothorax gibbosus]
MLAKRTKEALKTMNVPKVSTNPPSNSSKCPQSRTKSPIKSAIKRQANPPTQEISNDSDDIDNTLSPIKKLKIVSKVGEGSKQSEKMARFKKQLKLNVK